VGDCVATHCDRGVIALADSTQDVGVPAWTLAHGLPDIERELPESVRGMIERKIAQLGEDDRTLLTAASVSPGHQDRQAAAREIVGTARRKEPRALVAAAGQDGRSGRCW
jgi:hypothetical protein